MGDKITELDDAMKLAFTDASKTLAESKSRQWTATNFSVVGLMAIGTFGQDHGEHHKQRLAATVFAALILAGQVAVMRKCHSNLGTFRKRLRDMVDK